MIDTTDTCKDFGPIRIAFAKVQSKVNLKYDSIHKEVLGKFGSMLGTEMQDFHGLVSKVNFNKKFISFDNYIFDIF
jgi:dynein heavy chain 1